MPTKASSQAPPSSRPASPPSPDPSPPKPKPPRNAFSELMSAKPKPQPKPQLPREIRTPYPDNLHDPRNALLPYIQHPETYPSNIVIHHTQHSVLIRDAYPKSFLHLLLLPRDLSKTNLHPHLAFSDAAFLSLIRTEVSHAVDLAASELSRLLSPYSATSRARNEAMDKSLTPLPPGRDFHSLLKVGVHAHPSMTHLHIHILTPDMHSPALKHRKHYNSFNTDFFIPFTDLPLAEDDRRRDVKYQNGNLARDFECWRCGRNFGNRFKELKGHLGEEFEGWRAA